MPPGVGRGAAQPSPHRRVVRSRRPGGAQRGPDPEWLEIGDPELGVKHRDEIKFAQYDQEQGIDLWAYDGKNATTSLSDFTVILKWEDKGQIEIPFKNDAPVLSEAKVPAKIKLEMAAK